MKASQIVHRSARYLKHYSPTILTCIGAVGVVATAVTAVRATPKALQLIEQAGYEKGSDKNPIMDMEFTELTPIEMIKVSWKPYIPSIMIGSATIACIFGANVMNRRQQAALTSAYIFLNQTYKEYKDKIEDLYGKDANRKVQREIAKGKCEKLDHSKPEGDTVLFYESHYGNIFERTMSEVQDAEYRLNRKFALEGEASLNDFFEFLGLPENEIGDALGWSQEIICDFYKAPWIDFEHDLIEMDDGLECYIINMDCPPTSGYSIPF